MLTIPVREMSTYVTRRFHSSCTNLSCTA